MRYRAFFSYCRADNRVANWLHAQLDSYRTPAALVGVRGEYGPAPAKLHPIFRDRTDMAGGGQLSDRLDAALAESEALIVLCSPAAAQSEWVNQEVERFVALGRADRIFPVIAPDLRDTDSPEETFFPPALRGRGLLAADLRDIKLSTGKRIGDGRRGGELKLIAGLLGLPLDTVAQRESARQRTLIGRVAAGLAIVAALALFAFQQNREAYERRVITLAERSREASAAGSNFLAMRYALAGQRLAPSREAEFRAALATALFSVVESRGVTLASSDRSAAGPRRVESGGMIGDRATPWLVENQVSLSPDGAEALVMTENGIALMPFSGAQQPSQVLNGDLERGILATDGYLERGILTAGGYLVTTVRKYNDVGASTDLRVSELRTGRVLWTRNTNSILLAAAFNPQTGAGTIVTDGRVYHWTADGGSGDSPEFSIDPLDIELDSTGRHLLEQTQSCSFLVCTKRTRLWNIATGTQRALPAAETMSFSADGAALVLISEGVAQIYNSESGAPLGRSRGTGVSVAALSPDGRRVAAGRFDGGVELFEVDGMQLISARPMHSARVTEIAFSPDGRQLLTASQDGTARISDVATGEDHGVLQGFLGAIVDVQFSGDGGHILTVSEDGEARVWAANSVSHNFSRVLTTFSLAQPGPIDSASMSGDGRFLAFLAGESLLLANGQNGEIVATVPDVYTARGNRLPSVAVNHGGTHLLIADSVKCTVTLRRLDASLSVVRAIEVSSNVCGGGFLGFGATQLRVVFDPEGQSFAIKAGNHVEIWAVAGAESGTGRVQADSESSAWFDRTQVIEVGGIKLDLLVMRNTVIIRDQSTERAVTTLTGRSLVRSATPSADGQRLVVTSSDGIVRVWDISLLSLPMDRLERIACTGVLSGNHRSFSFQEMAADTLLERLWRRGNSDRDVCGGVEGAPRRETGAYAADVRITNTMSAVLSLILLILFARPLVGQKFAAIAEDSNLLFRSLMSILFLSVGLLQVAFINAYPPFPGVFGDVAPMMAQVTIAWAACCLGWLLRGRIVAVIAGALLLTLMGFVTIWSGFAENLFAFR